MLIFLERQKQLVFKPVLLNYDDILVRIKRGTLQRRYFEPKKAYFIAFRFF
jgi:hypothetical protein